MLSIVVGDEDRSDLDLDLDAIVREGARRMLMTALRAEVEEYIGAHSGERDATDQALVVRNGVARPRKVATAAGELEIQAPRVRASFYHRAFPWKRVGPYWLAQFLGAFLGAALVWLVYHDAISSYESTNEVGHSATFGIFALCRLYRRRFYGHWADGNHVAVGGLLAAV